MSPVQSMIQYIVCILGESAREREKETERKGREEELILDIKGHNANVD